MPGAKFGPYDTSFCLPMSHVATPLTLPSVVKEDLGGGKARVDVDAQRSAAGEPAQTVAETADVIAVILHVRRRRQPHWRGFGQEHEAVFGDRCFNGASFAAQSGISSTARGVRSHRAHRDVRADLPDPSDEAHAQLVIVFRASSAAGSRPQARRPPPTSDDVDSIASRSMTSPA